MIYKSASASLYIFPKQNVKTWLCLAEASSSQLTTDLSCYVYPPHDFDLGFGNLMGSSFGPRYTLPPSFMEIEPAVFPQTDKQTAPKTQPP